MTWTYTPVSTPRDQVRLLCGDTDTTDQQLQDEEIAYLLTLTSVPAGAASLACQALADKFSKLAIKAVGDLRIDQSRVAQSYADRAKELQRLAGGSVTSGKVPYAGGLTWTDEQTDILDTDRIQPYFRVSGMTQPSREDPVVSPRWS